MMNIHASFWDKKIVTQNEHAQWFWGIYWFIEIKSQKDFGVEGSG